MLPDTKLIEEDQFEFNLNDAFNLYKKCEKYIESVGITNFICDISKTNKLKIFLALYSKDIPLKKLKQVLESSLDITKYRIFIGLNLLYKENYYFSKDIDYNNLMLVKYSNKIINMKNSKAYSPKNVNVKTVFKSRIFHKYGLFDLNDICEKDVIRSLYPIFNICVRGYNKEGKCNEIINYMVEPQKVILSGSCHKRINSDKFRPNIIVDKILEHEFSV